MSGKSNRMGWSLVISFTVSIALMFYVFKDVKWLIFWQELKNLNLTYLPLVIISFCLSYVFRALRWKYLLPESELRSFTRLLKATMLGMLALTALPLRAGDVARPAILTRFEKVSYSSGLASIVTERVFDVIAILLMLAISLSELDMSHRLIRYGVPALALIAGTVSAVMISAYFWTRATKAVLRKLICLIFGERAIGRFCPELYKSLLNMMEEFIDGLRGMETTWELLLVIISSVLLWLSFAAVYYFTLLCFVDSASFAVGIVITVLIALAVAAPAAPGFAGTFELGCTLALSAVYSYSEELSVAYALFIHVLQIILTTLMGLYVLNSMKLNLQQVTAGRQLSNS